jgi:hypothetical protein
MRGQLFQDRGMPSENDGSVEAIREIELRRRRSRVSWIYLVYHAPPGAGREPVEDDGSMEGPLEAAPALDQPARDGGAPAASRLVV